MEGTLEYSACTDPGNSSVGGPDIYFCHQRICTDFPREAIGPNHRGLEPQWSILCREHIVAIQCYPSVDHQKVFMIHLNFPSCLELIEDKQET